ncbi:hypothetical protein LTR37_017671 [Vermiconidia calcicola]|uniref:Uncharacterized protein n=1 Tax=Vermiconidia calcicola TaxID=1690605 RepID=A0ACC3MJ68_9PEZI|nr:hypothetical protein LTR37_017671 [Vermiconidia calcicola]
MLNLELCFALMSSLALAAPAPTAVAMDVGKTFAASTTFSFAGKTLPTGLRKSSGPISDPDFLDHTFAKKNVAVKGGFLQLTVPGGQTGESISSAEVYTDFEMKYGSVRTWAILTETPGVCNGMFFYKTDSQETDIEWISDPKSLSNKDSPSGGRELQYTNQALNGNNGQNTHAYGPAPRDATSAVHEYRIDWTADSTKYYLDGVLQHTMTDNVPNVAGPWVWNNWANGDPNWTADPPKTNAVFKIQKIEMYYNPA